MDHMRLAVLSNERLSSSTHWSALRRPLLEPLASHPGGQLVSPPELAISQLREWRATFGQVRRADALFWMQMSARPETALSFASIARPLAQRSTVVIDAWRPSLPKIAALAIAQRMRPCFVFMREGCEELTRRYPRGTFEWIPFGVDTEVFQSRGEERDIFAYWMGRRYEPLHEALVAYCRERDLEYRFTVGGEITDPVELGRMVARSRYFVVTPPDLDNPGRTGGFSPLVMRYFEGLSAGARLLGVRPRSGEFEDLLPDDSILDVAPDGSDLAERLDADRDDPLIGEAVERACALVRAEHSWGRRAEQLYKGMLAHR